MQWLRSADRLGRAAARALVGAVCCAGLMLSLVVDQGAAQRPVGVPDASAGSAGKSNAMSKIRIEVYEGGARSASISVPTWLVANAPKLLPTIAGRDLQERVDVVRLLALLESPPADGLLIDIEDHAGRERLVISLVSGTKDGVPQ